MMHAKKGQGLSLNVVVVAIICLVVLVVLVALFSGKISIVSKDLTDCEAKGGFCAQKCDAEYYATLEMGCLGGDKCCVELFENKKTELVEGDLF